MNLIPGGHFFWGTSNLERELEYCRTFHPGYKRSWLETEKGREVNIAPLLVGRTEVSQEQWENITGRSITDQQRLAGSVVHYGRGASYPIYFVSWSEATSFCNKAGLRLLAEAEWEYACRAGTRTRYFWGDEIDRDYLWYQENSSGSDNKTQKVSQHLDSKNWNAFGLCDMSGNLWEWCSVIDHGSEGSQNKPSEHQPIYGGCWLDLPPACRSASRQKCQRASRRHDLGLRVCIALNSNKKATAC